MRAFAVVEVMLVASLAVALIAQPPSKQASAAPTEPHPLTQTYIGDVKGLGDGKIRSWVRAVDGRPAAIGVTFTEAALKGLPTTGDVGMSCCANELVLNPPRDLAIPPFTHIAINWNSNGHIPKGIYDKPHFDFHFYMIDNASRQKITADDPALNKPIAADCVPAGHIATPGMMKMGVHCVDPTSPEFNGVLFTKTFIYGAYDGKLSFVEPMITKTYLESKPDVTVAIKQPRVYPLGYFPSSYTVRFDPATKEYTVALEGLVAH